MRYEITYVTEKVNETWHNDRVELKRLNPQYISEFFNVDVKSYRCFKWGNRIDRYYPLYDNDVLVRGQYLRISNDINN